MAGFNKFILTDLGTALLNRVIAEQKTLKFTKFEIGSGKQIDIKTSTQLIDKFHEFSVNETNALVGGYTNIKGFFDNKNLTSEKLMSEIGVYAQIDDEVLTEILFSYSTSVGDGENIPNPTTAYFSRTLSVVNRTDDVVSVTFDVVIDKSRYDFNTLAELQSATYLDIGDKVNLWGLTVLGDIKKSSKIITSENAGIALNNGLFAKKHSDFIQLEDMENKLDKGTYTGDANDLNDSILENTGAITKNAEDINYSQTPIGSVLPFIGSTIPLGWLPCDGREIKEADYPDLYKLLQFGRKVHITDEDIAKNSHHRVPTLKSNNDGQGYVVSASSEFSTAYQAWRAFDNIYTENGAWISTNGVLEGWVQIDYPNEVCIDSLDLTSRNNSIGNRINYVGIRGIKADGTEVDLFVGQDVAEFTVNETRRFDCSKKRTKFKSFRITVKTASNYASIGELKLYTHNLLDEIPEEIANQDPTKKYLPFMNGMIPKGNTVDRDLGSYEFDAIRNITGEIDTSRGNEWLFAEEVELINTNGCFEVKTSQNSSLAGSTGSNIGTANMNMDASRIVLVSNENRPKNISFNYIVKASTVHNPSTAVDIADELNRKIEVNRNSIASLDDKVDSYEKRFEDVVLWEGLHQTNGTITLSEPFTNFREIEVIVSSYVSNALANIIARRFISKNILFNDNSTVDNAINDYRIGVDTTTDGYVSTYFRSNATDIYFGGRTSVGTISKITGIGRVK